jgi:hypothetical protein
MKTSVHRTASTLYLIEVNAGRKKNQKEKWCRRFDCNRYVKEKEINPFKK